MTPLEGKKQTRKLDASPYNSNKAGPVSGQLHLKQRAQTSLGQQQPNENLSKQSSDLSKQEMKVIIKRLHKPEMLLLSHLKSQIKYYYPQKMNKYLMLEPSGKHAATPERV
jgi:hypothetical protein